MSLLERIKLKADVINTTLSGIERELGFGNGTIRKWDKNLPSIEKIVKVANLLKTSTDYLLIGEDRSELTQDEKELIDVYRNLDRRGKSLVNAKAYEEQDRMKAKMQGESKMEIAEEIRPGKQLA